MVEVKKYAVNCITVIDILNVFILKRQGFCINYTARTKTAKWVMKLRGQLSVGGLLGLKLYYRMFATW